MTGAPPPRAARHAGNGAALPANTDSGRVTLITGGAGFLGCNLADRIASQGESVIIYDSLARANVERNLAWLQGRHGDRIRIRIADVRDAKTLKNAVRSADRVFHFAAQVAVTTSLVDPIMDFEVNARGTLTLLEALRACAVPPPLVFASTNKVYGKLDGVAVARRNSRYEPVDADIRRHGVSERQALSLYSPYGCSKGAADQYVLDYARVYGLKTVAFRMSCLYGPRQFGTEDQGWVAHFAISALRGTPITIYGDGKQVRDVLFVDDVVDALLLAQAHMPQISGQAFNIGGGPENAVSLVELLALIRTLNGRMPEISFGPTRAGDQLFYVSDTRKFQAATGWRPANDVRAGVQKLFAWLESRHRPETAREAERVLA
jgi:CDP-paratose 2-epimerase